MLESFLVSEPTEEDRDPRQTRAPSTPGGPRLGAASVPRRFGPDDPRSHDVMHADRVSQPPVHVQPDRLPVARGRWNAGSWPFRAAASRVQSGPVGSKNRPDLRPQPERQQGDMKSERVKSANRSVEDVRSHGRPVRASLSRSTSPCHDSTRFADLTCLLIVSRRDGQISSSWSSRLGYPT